MDKNLEACLRHIKSLNLHIKSLKDEVDYLRTMLWDATHDACDHDEPEPLTSTGAALPADTAPLAGPSPSQDIPAPAEEPVSKLDLLVSLILEE